jgi:hypothetical protein
MSYRIREAIIKACVGSYEERCQRLESLLTLFCELNPSAHMAFEVDEDQHFHRAFLSNPDTKLVLKNA